MKQVKLIRQTHGGLIRLSTVLAVSTGIVLLGLPGSAAEPELIPREVLFGNPVKTNPRISPDGKMMAYLAPVKNVLNVWVKTIGKEDDRVVTKDADEGHGFAKPENRLKFYAAAEKFLAKHLGGRYEEAVEN